MRRLFPAALLGALLLPGGAAGQAILVTEPTAAKTAAAGGTLDVKWTSPGFTGATVNIGLANNDTAWSLASGTPNDGQQAVTIPANARAGLYRIVVQIPGGAAFSSASFRVAVLGEAVALLPDLVACLAWNGKRPYMNEDKTITARIRNSGNAPSTATTFDFRVERLGTRSFPLPALAPGAEHRESVKTSWPSTGHKDVRVTVDPANTVREKDETNNNITGQIAVILPGQDRYVAEKNACAGSN